MLAPARVPLARPGRQEQQQAGVAGGTHLVGLLRIEVRDEARTARDRGPDSRAALLDLALARRHDDPRALVDLVLLELLARRQIDRDHPSLRIGPKDLRLVRLNVERGDVPGLHDPGIYPAARLSSAACSAAQREARAHGGQPERDHERQLEARERQRGRAGVDRRLDRLVGDLHVGWRAAVLAHVRRLAVASVASAASAAIVGAAVSAGLRTTVARPAALARCGLILRGARRRAGLLATASAGIGRLLGARVRRRGLRRCRGSLDGRPPGGGRALPPRGGRRRRGGRGQVHRRGGHRHGRRGRGVSDLLLDASHDPAYVRRLAGGDDRKSEKQGSAGRHRGDPGARAHVKHGSPPSDSPHAPCQRARGMYYPDTRLCASSFSASSEESVRRMIHSVPGWSVRPCAMIETRTASAAMSAIRSASGTPEPSTNSANAMVATPFGPNHAMNAFPARSTWRVPASAVKTATGRATSSVNATIPTAAQPSPKRPSSVMIAPKTRKMASLTSSIMSSLWCSKHSRMSGRQMPSAMAATKTAMKPFPSGGSVAVPYAANATPRA